MEGFDVLRKRESIEQFYTPTYRFNTKIKYDAIRKTFITLWKTFAKKHSFKFVFCTWNSFKPCKSLILFSKNFTTLELSFNNQFKLHE